jgi:hypothetical protein
MLPILFNGLCSQVDATLRLLRLRLAPALVEITEDVAELVPCPAPSGFFGEVSPK